MAEQTFEVFWCNPATGIARTIEVPDEAAAQERVDHYTDKYGAFAGFQAPTYRTKPEAV